MIDLLVGAIMILPVFAGMIPVGRIEIHLHRDSPRIRGDDPDKAREVAEFGEFSPYSRG